MHLNCPGSTLVFLVTSCFCSSVDCLPPVKNVTLEEAKTLLKKRQNTIYNGEASPTVTEYDGPVLTENQNFLSHLWGEFKTKNHIINFLHVPMTSAISEYQYSAMHYRWENQYTMNQMVLISTQALK